MRTTSEAMVKEGKDVGVKDLVEQFQQAGPLGWSTSETRYAVWDGQTEDGHKHGRDVKPWNNASDTRIFLADDIINDNVALEVMSFWRALLRAEGVGMEDIDLAGQVTKVLKYYVKNRMGPRLWREVQLSANYLEEYGWTMLHIFWDRRVSRRLFTLNLTFIMQEAGRAGLEMLPTMIMDPTQEAEAARILGQLYRMYIEAEMREIKPEEYPELSDSKLRKMVKELREGDETSVPLPYVLRNEPAVAALRPWREVFVPVGADDPEDGPVFVLYYKDEQWLREKVFTEGWDADWVEEVVKLKGEYSVWTRQEDKGPGSVSEWAWDDTDTGISDKIEILYVYRRLVDDDGIPAIYCTVVHSKFTNFTDGREAYAVHGVLDYAHGEMPFIYGAREYTGRELVNARGVPQIAAPWQREIKVQRDGIIDRTSMTTVPPLLFNTLEEDVEFEFGPGARVPYTPGREPKWMDVPRTDGTAELVHTMVQREADNYFGRLTADVPPARALAKQELMVGNYLWMWRGAFKQIWQLLQQHVGMEELQRVTGQILRFGRDAREVGRQYDLSLNFDVRELDPDMAAAKLDAVGKLVPEDVMGVIDRVRLMKLKLSAIDPQYAEILVSDQGEASQKLFESVRNEIAQMFLGNQPQLVEAVDPSAWAKLRFASEIVAANPVYQQAMQTNERFGKMLELYAKNLAFSVKQEEAKKMGRIGVNPQVK